MRMARSPAPSSSKTGADDHGRPEPRHTVPVPTRLPYMAMPWGVPSRRCHRGSPLREAPSPLRTRYSALIAGRGGQGRRSGLACLLLPPLIVLILFLPLPPSEPATSSQVSLFHPSFVHAVHPPYNVIVLSMLDPTLVHASLCECVCVPLIIRPSFSLPSHVFCL